MEIVYFLNFDLLIESIDDYLSKKGNYSHTMGISRNTLGRIRERKNPSIKTLLEISHALKVNPSVFFSARPNK